MFEGLSGGPGSLIKYNPLTNITSAEVWNFLRVMVSSHGCLLLCFSLSFFFFVDCQLIGQFLRPVCAMVRPLACGLAVKSRQGTGRE